MADKLKFLVALALVAAGVAGFYLFSQQATIVRVLCVLVGLGAGAAVVWTTAAGREFVAFSKDSIAETRKVVWPTQRETVQTTAIVFVFVLVMAIMLWMTDKTLELVIYDLVLGWKKL